MSFGGDARAFRSVKALLFQSRPTGGRPLSEWLFDFGIEEWVSSGHEPTIMATARDFGPRSRCAVLLGPARRPPAISSSRRISGWLHQLNRPVEPPDSRQYR